MTYNEIICPVLFPLGWQTWSVNKTSLYQLGAQTKNNIIAITLGNLPKKGTSYSGASFVYNGRELAFYSGFSIFISLQIGQPDGCSIASEVILKDNEWNWPVLKHGTALIVSVTHWWGSCIRYFHTHFHLVHNVNVACFRGSLLAYFIRADGTDK